MAEWKLIRQDFGTEQYKFSEGDEATIGRGLNNTVTLSSIVISRNHCVMSFKNDEVIITDLKSSNGVYVGQKRIPPNIPYNLQDSDEIGFGWAMNAPLVKIKDSEKYTFKLTKIQCHLPLSKRLFFQNQHDIDDIEAAIATLDNNEIDEKNIIKKMNPKRKLSITNIKQEKTDNEGKKNIANDVISILSDSDIEMCSNIETENKRRKLDLSQEKQIKEEQLKNENDVLQFEAFNVKQEYLGYDDDIQQVDSDSDSESEHWFLRLSQSSPGKPFTKIVQNKVNDLKQDDTSYSQTEDFVLLDIKEKSNESEEEFSDDCITIPDLSPQQQIDKAQETVKEICDNKTINKCNVINSMEKSNDIVTITSGLKMEKMLESKEDRLDGDNLNFNDIDNSTSRTSIRASKLNTKKIQMIEPLIQPPKKQNILHDSKTINNLNKPRTKRNCSTTKKKEVNHSRKEERKKKLKEIASKEKDECENENTTSGNNSTKQVVVAKITTSNRGAFLTDMSKTNVESLKNTNLNKTKDEDSSNICKHNTKSSTKIKTNKKSIPEKEDQSKSNCPHTTNKFADVTGKSFKSFESESRIPLKSVKPLKESDKLVSGKPFSKVEPLCEKSTSSVKKTVKKVHFTNEKPIVHIFEIEPGNKMKKTSSIKTFLLDVRHLPVFSLEKITLMKILCWNPHWLDEQINNNDPPPILGHNNPPLAIFHSFTNHKQYIQLVGDLLLMEIWECLTQGYMRLSKQNHGMQMRIDSLPPVPPQERFFELFNINVNLSVPTTEIKSVPRVGDVLLAKFGPENSKCSRFLFVHNVRCLPSPSNNIHSFFTISLYATFTEKMESLRPGEVMYVRNLAYINKELMLFEAMEHLAGSPLSEAILKPQPQHFLRLKDPSFEQNLRTQWTITLNASQKMAVTLSVTAALGDKPSIQMVQGPPGTGKSSVICAIVMTYFYNAAEKKQQNRGKILICATSNAAVDELVIRLLKIRQNLPKAERFRMVRVGRAEAMHPRARDVSSQQLAQRDAARINVEPSRPGLAEEISHLEAKINMWKTQAQDARDPVRVAYCQSRIDNLVNRISLLRGGGGIGGGDGVRPELVAQAERRIIEGADIIVTTLASAHNHKMKGLRRRIALCIIDEAGQAIEPETLIPLTLDVTRITLIGDPQQLPGFICSQRAKKHGLGESLFSRLTSTTETWDGDNPVVLLNQQYRMHPNIVDYPNRAFYGGKIQTISMPRSNIKIPPYSIICIASGDKGQGTSGANEMEAWGVARLAAALAATLQSKNLSLAVITPYSAHRDLVKRNLRMLQDSSENQVEVNTVDSFQGQERDVVVVSLARSHGVGFLTDAGRMNVMLTRAKHALLVCLNPLAVMKNYQWRTLIEDAQKRKVYRTLPKAVCQGAASSSIPHDEILKHIQQKP